jgi:hypothetical protein
VLIWALCDVGEVTIYVEFHQRSKPMKCFGCNERCRLNGILQLSVVSVEDNIGLPLFVHVAGVPQCTEICSQWFKGFDLWKRGSLRQFPRDESDDYEKLAKVELIPLVLRLSTVKL